MTIPAVAVILSVFAGALLLSRLKIPLGLALVAGGVVLDLAGGRTFAQLAGHMQSVLSSGQLWYLLAVMALIIEFGRFMTRPENAKEIVAAITRWGGRHGRVWTLISLPGVIGMIPMAGGAIFSAPLVGQAVEGVTLSSKNPPSAEWKTAVNYWFRHTIEHWWPLYPGVILALSLFEMPTPRFISSQIVFTPVALFAGYWFLIRPHVADLSATKADGGPVSGRIFFLASLLGMVILSALFLPLVLEKAMPGIWGQNGKLAGMLIGLAAAAAFVVIDENRRGRVLFMRRAFTRDAMGTIGTVGGVIIFQYLLKASGLIDTACSEMKQWGVPVVIAVAALPFLAGVVTGLAVGFVGASFPLVLALMATPGSGLTPLATLALAYGFGHSGMMLSPVHICFLVTRDFFSASLSRAYALILPCVATMMAFSVLACVVLLRLGL